MNSKRLKDRTDQERKEHLSFFMSLSMKELRHRQYLIVLQKQEAFNGYMKDFSSQFQHVRERADSKWDPVMENLQLMDIDIFETIDQKAFPWKYSDPCSGRVCNECEIGGCDHGIEVN